MNLWLVPGGSVVGLKSEAFSGEKILQNCDMFGLDGCIDVQFSMVAFDAYNSLNARSMHSVSALLF